MVQPLPRSGAGTTSQVVVIRRPFDGDARPRPAAFKATADGLAVE